MYPSEQAHNDPSQIIPVVYGFGTDTLKKDPARAGPHIDPFVCYRPCFISVKFGFAFIRFPDPAFSVLLVQKAVYILLRGPEAVGDVMSRPVLGSNGVLKLRTADNRHHGKG